MSKIIKGVIYISLGFIVLFAALSDSSIGVGNNPSNDIVPIALQEVGTKGGDKYSAWYVGHADGVAWCARFVSWCANEAGISTDCIPKFQNCNMGIRWFKEKQQYTYTSYYGGSEYIPKAGDLIFFAWQHNKNNAEHVGIVKEVKEDIVYTVEGNTTNMVAERNYPLSFKSILGYATPEYPTKSDLSGDTNAEKSWNFFISKGCNEYAAAGILGNLKQESGIEPNKQQYDGGVGRGIAQWTYNEGRWDGLITMAEPILELTDSIGSIKLKEIRKEVKKMAVKKGNAPPRYDEAFKIGAIKLVVDGGRSPKEVGQELGVHPDTVKNWLKSSGYSTQVHREKAESKKVKQLETENRALKKQLEKKQEALDVLKKSIGIISDF